jgi:hypothetical protein
MMTDDDIEAMYTDAGYDGEPVEPTAIQPAPQQPVHVPLYPLALAQQGLATTDGAGFLQQKMGPLPVWAWGLIGLSVAGGGGYLYWRSRQSEANPEGDDEGSKSNGHTEHRETSNGGWAPSRSAFVATLQKYVGRKGLTERVTVWTDADEAKKKGRMGFVSPLVNMQPGKGVKLKVDAELEKLSRREGLNPIAHDDGSVGFYPTDSKRGRQWEEYVDALRDEGQTV